MKLVLYPEVEAARLAQIKAAAAPMRVANCASETEAIAEIADAKGFFGKTHPCDARGGPRVELGAVADR